MDGLEFDDLGNTSTKEECYDLGLNSVPKYMSITWIASETKCFGNYLMFVPELGLFDNSQESFNGTPDIHSCAYVD